MQPTICSRCKKNIAVIFVTRMDKDGPIDEGLTSERIRQVYGVGTHREGGHIVFDY